MLHHTSTIGSYGFRNANKGYLRETKINHAANQNEC